VGIKMNPNPSGLKPTGNPNLNYHPYAWLRKRKMTKRISLLCGKLKGTGHFFVDRLLHFPDFCMMKYFEFLNSVLTKKSLNKR
jgi:hypothetical protein